MGCVSGFRDLGLLEYDSEFRTGFQISRPECRVGGLDFKTFGLDFRTTALWHLELDPIFEAGFLNFGMDLKTLKIDIGT